MKNSLSFSFALLLAAACGGASPEPMVPAAEGPETTGAEPAVEKAAAGACAEIDTRCDPHEDKGGLAKECHDLAEGPSADEATCSARRDECLAACPQQ
jgi:hypothetical protein